MTDSSPLPVFVIYWKAPDWLTQSIDSMLQSDIPVAITVVANSDDLPDLPDDVQVLRVGRNLGYTGGANIGLSAWTDHEWCVLAAHDLLVSPDTFNAMLRVGNQFQDAGVIGPSIEGWRPSHGAWHEGGPVTWVDWTSGACMMIRRTCYDAVGGFDERLGSYAEDIDYCMRASRAGWRIGIVPAAESKTIGTKADSEWRLAMSRGNGIYIAAKMSGYRSAVSLMRRLAGSWVRHALLGIFAPSGRAAHRMQRRANGRALPRAIGLIYRLHSERANPSGSDRDCGKVGDEG